MSIYFGLIMLQSFQFLTKVPCYSSSLIQPSRSVGREVILTAVRFIRLGCEDDEAIDDGAEIKVYV